MLFHCAYFTGISKHCVSSPHSAKARQTARASRRARPTTATSAAPAITHCSCSTNSATWSVAPFAPATCIAPTDGGTCWFQSWSATGNGRSASIFAAIRPSPRRRSTTTSKPGVCSTPSGFPRTRCCKRASLISSSGRSAGQRAMCAGITPVSAIRPEPGRGPGGSSPRSSGIPASCTRASDSSSPI